MINLQRTESYIDELVGMNATLHGSMPQANQVNKARFLSLAIDISELLAETMVV